MRIKTLSAMCTVTFLPLGGTDFILTSNRDEQPSRPAALPPQQYDVQGVPVIFPKDAQSGGTWIAASETATLCLLNGAFEAHTPQPPYRHSRGLVVTDFFKYESSQSFIEQYDFTGIEPFTLLIVNHLGGLTLTELRWTETKKLHTATKNIRQPHLWSSATLYAPTVRREREQWFGAWLTNRDNYEWDDILHFHHFGGSGNAQDDLLMKRDFLSTVSITSVMRQNGGIDFLYEDLATHAIKNISFNHQVLNH